MAKKSRSTKNLPQNWQLLNYIRQNASEEYRSNVPVATQSNVAQISEYLWEPTNGRYRNEFITNLVNRIGEVVIRSRRWTDPFKEFKKKDVPYGSTIEEIASGLLYGHTRDYNDTAELLRVNKPYTMAAFHQPVRNETYPLTVDEVDLRAAFIEEYGERLSGAERLSYIEEYATPICQTDAVLLLASLQ